LLHAAGAAAVLGLLVQVVGTPPVVAGPSADVVAYRGLQPASLTATPRIRLSTLEPSPIPIGTGEAGPGSVEAGEAPRPGPTPRTADERRAARRSARQTAAADEVADPGSARDIAPPALPGSAGGGSGDGAVGSDGPAGAAEAADQPVAGPRGIVDVPVDEGLVRALWAEHGSPHAGRPIAVRLAAGRPGLLGWWPLYLALGAAYLVVAGRLVGLLAGVSLEVEGPESDGTESP
jgi:hypothetical protein